MACVPTKYIVLKKLMMCMVKFLNIHYSKKSVTEGTRELKRVNKKAFQQDTYCPLVDRCVLGGVRVGSVSSSVCVQGLVCVSRGGCVCSGVGVCVQGCLCVQRRGCVQGVYTSRTQRHSPTRTQRHVEGMTHACENTTFLQLLLRAGGNYLNFEKFNARYQTSAFRHVHWRKFDKTAMLNNDKCHDYYYV